MRKSKTYHWVRKQDQEIQDTPLVIPTVQETDPRLGAQASTNQIENTNSKAQVVVVRLPERREFEQL